MKEADDTKTILVEDFKNPINEWNTLNDPVMGGESYSDLEIDSTNGIAKFTGYCAIVPSLQAPGFITMETGADYREDPGEFPDVATCTGLRFEMKTNTEYTGYRISFGKAHPIGNRFAYGYKAPLHLDEDLPPVGEFGIVDVPFTKFSDKWDDGTGDIEVECADNPRYCPRKKWLQSMETISFWGEGVEGMVDLEIKTISAFGCDMNASEAPVAPAMITSTMHTVMANPIYISILIIWTVALILVGTSLYCCCCRDSNKKMQPSAKRTHYSDVATIDAFNDDEMS